jgi:hypothetical protein
MEFNMKNKSLLVFIAFVSVILMIGLVWWAGRRARINNINSFEECVRAGYGILESDPPQCVVPGGLGISRKGFTADYGSDIPEPRAGSQKCGFENCHGLEMKCGPNVPEMCTLDYQIGDRCREFGFCKMIGNECHLVTSERLTQCQSCVRVCQEEFKDAESHAQQVEMWECERKCGE